MKKENLENGLQKSRAILKAETTNFENLVRDSYIGPKELGNSTNLTTLKKSVVTNSR